MAITKAQIVPGLWTHKTWPISFTLVVDNFGVKYVGEEHVKHLMNCLRESYNITHKWKGKIYWHHTWLGLRTKASWPVHARPYEKGTTAIQSLLSKETTGFTLPMRANQIRSQNTVWKDAGWRSISWRSIQEIHTASMRKILVLWNGGRQHYPDSSQRRRFTASQPNNRHYGQSKTTSILPCLTRRGNPDIFSKQHGIGSTQRRRLPEQNWNKKQSRRPFLLIFQRHNPSEQRCHSKRRSDHQQCNVFRSWGRA